MISDKGTLIFLHYNDGVHRTVTKHQACSSVMAKYRANESRAKHTWAMPSAADIQRC